MFFQPVYPSVVPARRRIRGPVATVAAALAVLGVLFLPQNGAADDRDEAGRDGGRDGASRSVTPAAGAHVMPADLEDVEHMCALLTSCDRLPLPSGIVPKDFVSCTRALYAELASAAAVSFSLTLRDCGLRASSCGELRMCALRGAKADVCAGRGKTSPVDLCDGDGRAITCSSERVALVRDCPRGGEQCVVRDGHAVCALGGCEKDAAPACSPSGTRVLECKKGTLLSLDCGAFGLRCAPGVIDGPRCATQASPCNEGTTRCEGSTAVACWHGHEVRIDCGARGLGCGAGTSALDAGGATISPIGVCVSVNAAKGACAPSAAPRCDGATLRWCAWGQPRAYLCKSVGLSRCVADDKGARCVP